MDYAMDFIRNSTCTVFVWLESQTRLLEIMERNQKKTDAFWSINGSRCTSEAGVYREFGEKLFFPSYFGKNWGALVDCMLDRVVYSADKNNHYFVINDAFLIGKLDTNLRCAFFSTLCELERNWNCGTEWKRGQFRFILCVREYQVFDFTQMLSDMNIPYAMFRDINGDLTIQEY